jgi:hypothetical protein
MPTQCLLRLIEGLLGRRVALQHVAAFRCRQLLGGRKFRVER